MKHSMQKLQELAVENGPLCVGLDTDPSYIPESVIARYPSKEDAVLAYNLGIIKQVVKDKSACCFKVQIAYYEAMGLKGMEVYAKTIRAVRESGLICISDIKRGDIAATASAYARAHFSGDFETDIITINPYMGFDTLKPFTEWCAKGKGIFVLLRTSNPGMADIESGELKDGSLVLDKVGNELLRLKDEFKKLFPEQTCSPVGAVVGCTEEENARSLRKYYENIFFLIPGYGAQGGAARIAQSLFEKDKDGLFTGTVNSSRGILCAWKKDESLKEKVESGKVTMEDIVASAAKASLAAKKDLLGA